MSAPWAWRLDPLSGVSSSLGPSTSTTNVSLNPLSSLSHASTSVSAADDVFWQDFRPKKWTRNERKRANLHRFDSDDEAQNETFQLTCEDSGPAREAGAESDEDAAGLGQTSSDESDASEEKDTAVEGNLSETAEVQAQDDKEANTSIKHKRGRPPLAQPAADSTSTHLIANAIHRHALASNDEIHDFTVSGNDMPPPLTYKETVRLVRLIAMIFRFPKSSRRFLRRRNHTTDHDAAPVTPTESTFASTSTAPSENSTSLIELKPKYRASSSSSASALRKPRILAKVHSEDARPNSDAVLKLIALIPAALPARVGCADWIASLAVRAKRDEYGNILLPSSAYETTVGGRGESVDVEGEEGADQTIKGEGEGEGKVTRSMRQRMGQEAPAIPLPRFWRRRQASQEDAEVRCKTEEGQEVKVEEDRSSTVGEGEADALVSAASDVSRSQSPHPPSTPDSQQTEGRSRRAPNLSKLLAERMREKRQAKALLLRTHQSLRKRRRSDEQEEEELRDGAGGAEERGMARDEEETFDAETVANTRANRAGGAMLEEGRSIDSTVQEENDVTIKQEP